MSRQLNNLVVSGIPSSCGSIVSLSIIYDHSLPTLLDKLKLTDTMRPTGIFIQVVGGRVASSIRGHGQLNPMVDISNSVLGKTSHKRLVSTLSNLEWIGRSKVLLILR